MGLLTIFFFGFVILALSRTFAQEQDQLLHVHIIFREGDHIPERLCPNDNNQWSGQLGAITARGMHQQMLLGQTIYRKYADIKGFIEKRYNPKEIYVRSIDTNRTITSATSNLLGMFYNRTEQTANVDYPNGDDWPQGYVPVPTHMVEKNIDHVCNPNAECYQQNLLIHNLTGTAAYINFTYTERATILSIQNKCNDPTMSLLNADYIVDANQVEKLQGRTPLLNDHEEEVLRKVASFKNGLEPSAVSRELAGFRGGQLLWDIIDRMDQKVTCTQNPDSSSCNWMNNHKIYMYSLTQPGVDALLAALAPSPPAPLNAAADGFALFIELYQSVYSPSVQVSYTSINQSSEESITQYIAACNNTKCSLDSFKNNAFAPRISDITQVCNSSQPTPSWLWRRETPYSEERRGRQSNDEELVLVQIIWRHGDRNPKSVCKNDNNTDSTWPLGFDQLSSLGMEQHQQLGALLYSEYVTNQHFLSEEYNANEVFVRSSDLNRTIISGMSNLIGMYFNKGNLTNAFPVNVNESWPYGFVPVPIHTTEDAKDYITDPHTACQRKDDLVAISMETPEIKNFLEDNAEFIEQLSEVCGQELDLLSLSTPVDTQEVELIHNKSTIFSARDYEKMRALSNVGENLWNGLLNTSTYEGFDLRVELARLSGGPLLFDMIDRMDLKTYCLDPAKAQGSECSWISPLKYYVYSARGTTVNAFLAALEAKEVYPDGVPNYAAAIILELWKAANGQYEVTVKFREGPNSYEFKDITSNVNGCPSSGRCTFSSFKYRSQPFNPGDIAKSCQERAFFNETTPTPSDGSPTLLSLFSYSVSLLIGFWLSFSLRP